MIMVVLQARCTSYTGVLRFSPTRVRYASRSSRSLSTAAFEWCKSRAANIRVTDPCPAYKATRESRLTVCVPHTGRGGSTIERDVAVKRRGPRPLLIQAPRCDTSGRPRAHTPHRNDLSSLPQELLTFFTLLRLLLVFQRMYGFPSPHQVSAGPIFASVGTP